MSFIQAIQKLRPEAEVTIIDNDYATAIWHKLEGKPPTEAEVLAKLEDLKQQEADAKAIAEAKLVALGLSIEDLRALGLG
jgi:hypothetical protein